MSYSPPSLKVDRTLELQCSPEFSMLPLPYLIVLYLLDALRTYKTIRAAVCTSRKAGSAPPCVPTNVPAASYISYLLHFRMRAASSPAPPSAAACPRSCARPSSPLGHHTSGLLSYHRDIAPSTIENLNLISTLSPVYTHHIRALLAMPLPRAEPTSKGEDEHCSSKESAKRSRPRHPAPFLSFYAVFS